MFKLKESIGNNWQSVKSASDQDQRIGLNGSVSVASAVLIAEC